MIEMRWVKLQMNEVIPDEVVLKDPLTGDLVKLQFREVTTGFGSIPGLVKLSTEWQDVKVQNAS